MFEVERKVFFPCAWQGQQSFDHLLYKIFELCNFEVWHHLNAHHVKYLCTKF
jgi:hypothetical protein